MTTDQDVAEWVIGGRVPGLTFSYDAGRLRALGLLATALLQTGTSLRRRVHRVRTLAQRVCELLAAGHRFTQTHHFAMVAGGPCETVKTARARGHLRLRCWRQAMTGRSRCSGSAPKRSFVGVLGE